MGKHCCLQVFISEDTYNKSAVHVFAVALFSSNKQCTEISLFLFPYPHAPLPGELKMVFLLCIVLNLM